MARKKQAWQEGDYFSIPLADGTFVMAQVLKYEPQALNSVICAIFIEMIEKQPSGAPRSIDENKLISVLFVTRDLLDSGVWFVFGRGPTIDPQKYIGLEDLRRKGFVGTEIIGSGNVIKLMNAFYGLIPWNSFYDPHYLDKLLVSPDRKPRTVLLK